MNYFNLTQIKDLVIREALRKIVDAIRALEAISAQTSLFGTHNQRPKAQSVAVGTYYRETDRLHTYRVIRVGQASIWQVQEGLGGPLTGTLFPDTKPTDLGIYDEGFRFFSTDFNREFRWSNVAGTFTWFDSPGAPPRFQIGMFDHPPEPIEGWVLCDGGLYTASNQIGEVNPYLSPDLTTLHRFLRSAVVAEGGIIGGSATTHTHLVDPPTTDTSTPSGTENVQSGGGSLVAADDHTHTVNISSFGSEIPSGFLGDDALPPYYNVAPYIRV